MTVFLLLLFACEGKKTLDTFFISGSTMGTTYSITVVDSIEKNEKSSLKEDVDSLLESLNQQMSTYIEGSDILSFNDAPINTKQIIKRDFFEVLELSQKMSEFSNGRFDISVGPLIELWGFGKRVEQKVPSDIEIAAAKSQVGWKHLTLDKNDYSISKSKDLWIDTSAVAKGYAVDKVFELLLEKGYQHFLVEIGGEMRVKGVNPNQVKWRLGIEVPSLLQQQSQQIVQLSDAAIATSGDYRNYFEENGERFSHTIDPQTGRPVKHKIASVTVISDTAAEADALATTLNVLGEIAALELATKENIPVYFILYTDVESDNSERYETVYTDSFRQYIQ